MHYNNLVKRIFSVILILIFIFGCAYNSGVVVNGDNLFSITNQASTGLQGHGKLKAEAVAQGTQFCSAMNKDFEIISQDRICEIITPGCFPAIEIFFSCVD